MAELTDTEAKPTRAYVIHPDLGRARTQRREPEHSLAEAVALAGRNAARLRLANVRFFESQWFSALGGQRYGVIVSNPPYIRACDPHLLQGDLRFEPGSALVAGEDGLADIRQIVSSAPDHLSPGGWLLLEHGYDQADDVRRLLAARGFADVDSCKDLGGHERVSLGRWS